jgi:peptidoglycan/LPS O-acetylase OafA/YrhL
VFLLAAFTLYVLAMHRALIGDELAAVGWISVYGANWAQWAGKMQNLYTSLSLGHTWTLAVEEQFYLVWPWLIVLVLRFKPRLRTLAAGLVGGVILVTLERAFLATRLSIPAGAPHAAAAQIFERSIGIRTDLRADTLLLGALAAVLLHSGWRPGRGVRLAGTAALVVLVTVSLTVQPDARWMYQWGFTVVDAAGAVLCIAVLDRTWRVGWVFRTGPAAWLGRMSYALYLWHLPVFVAIAVDAPDLPVGIALVLAWIITFACAIASYYFVETRFLRLKGRLSERAHGAAAKPGPAPQAATQPTSR